MLPAQLMSKLQTSFRPTLLAANSTVVSYSSSMCFYSKARPLFYRDIGGVVVINVQVYVQLTIKVIAAETANVSVDCLVGGCRASMHVSTVWAAAMSCLEIEGIKSLRSRCSVASHMVSCNEMHVTQAVGKLANGK